jgi:hypothetical protein
MVQRVFRLLNWSREFCTERQASAEIWRQFWALGDLSDLWGLLKLFGIVLLQEILWRKAKPRVMEPDHLQGFHALPK